MNKILRVFTKEYKEEVEHYYFVKEMMSRSNMKLKLGCEESVDDKIARLKGYKSNCSIKVSF